MLLQPLSPKRIGRFSRMVDPFDKGVISYEIVTGKKLVRAHTILGVDSMYKVQKVQKSSLYQE
ncbi:hypothetical protein GCM10028773_11370 [Spirosoma koreense]